jgi:hypothetical protein
VYQLPTYSTRMLKQCCVIAWGQLRCCTGVLAGPCCMHAGPMLLLTAAPHLSPQAQKKGFHWRQCQRQRLHP